jgi:hypothetical protein
MSGWTNSSIGSASYTINGACATPTFSPAGGSYSSTQTVTISCSTSGATIYYTTDGSTPTSSSTQYTGAISVSSTETVKAIAEESGYSNSSVASASYTVGGSQTYTTPGTYTWTCPSGVSSVQVRCWGGGEGGSNGALSPGQGGVGGGYSINTSVAVTPGIGYPVTVGAGGTNSGSLNGGNSEFAGNSATVAGYGGNVAGTNTYNGGSGGASGTSTGGGGGSSGGTGSNGNAGAAGNSGGAGGAAVTGGGAGGAGSSTSANGINGSSPGGGGGGSSGVGGSQGGVGGSGQVIITW